MHNPYSKHRPRRGGLAGVLLAATALCGTVVIADAAEAGDIQAIIIGDTADERIGRQMAEDLKNIRDSLERIAKKTGMPLRMKIMHGGRVTKHNLELALDSMRIEPDDVVFFYFTGHGDRPPQSSDQWPRLAIGGEPIPLSSIIDTIDKLDPRLTIMLADVCNRYALDQRGSVDAVPMAAVGDLEHAAYDDMFRDAAGYFIATSSSPGQLSSAGGNRGSLFSMQWVTAIKHAIALPEGDWDNVQALLAQPLVTLFEENTLQVPRIAMQIRPTTKATGGF